jgi:hypothetical protein
MIGFITDQYTAAQVNESVANAQLERGLPVFWLPGVYEVFHGEHIGMYFIPCDDDTFATPLRGHPPLTPVDFPEFSTIIEELGGLDARVDISPTDIIE